MTSLAELKFSWVKDNWYSKVLSVRDNTIVGRAASRSQVLISLPNFGPNPFFRVGICALCSYMCALFDVVTHSWWSHSQSLDYCSLVQDKTPALVGKKKARQTLGKSMHLFLFCETVKRNKSHVKKKKKIKCEKKKKRMMPKNHM